MTNKRVAILQSNFIPWKGYFDMINMVDEFVVFDDVQYTKRDWRNRNRIKTPQGLKWLSIPVLHESPDQKIQDTRIVNGSWKKKNWQSIALNYSRAKHFKEYKELFEDLFLNNDLKYLSEINVMFLREINKILGISTKISLSRDYKYAKGKTERLLAIVKMAGGSEYLSGPAAKDYLDIQLFKQEGIGLSWMDYSGYPEYRQLFPPFEHGVTILDLIFNEGSEAKKFMKSFQNET